MWLTLLNARVSGLLLVALLLGSGLMFLRYERTQFPRHRGAARVVDFSSFVLSLILRPIIRHFFTIPEADWNRDREVEGLQNSVDIYRDDMGIPYIFAHTEHDARFAQLFFEYTERPFQCEFLRRLASGRLSETFGEAVFPSDYRARLLVDADSIRYRMASLSPEQKTLLDAAVKALNQAAVLLPAIPVELAALGWSPTEWTAVEYLQVLETMYLFFARGFGIEYSKVALQRHLKEYWPFFDVKHLREVPLMNVEGEFPSLFDQQGKRVQMPAMPPVDDSWARRRPADVANMVAMLRRMQATKETQQQKESPAPGGQSEAGEAAEAAETEAEPAGGGEESRDMQAASSSEAAADGGGSGDGGGDDASAGPYVEGWMGSNAWTVAGRFTASGKPILAGDTHLHATAPGFWMPALVNVGPSKLLTSSISTPPQQQLQQQHLLLPHQKSSSEEAADEGSSNAAASAGNGKPEQQQRVIGVSAVGLGLICMGHSQYGAWGQTIAATDSADFFLITLNKAGTHYKYDGKWHPLRMRVEEFSIKGKEEKKEKLMRYTHHGPLISDAVPALQNLLKPGQALALATIASRAPISSDTFIAFAKAKTWQDFVVAGSLNQQLGLTTLWATAAGDIGGTVGGAVPIRSRWTNTSTFRDGSSSREDWQGVLPQSKIANAVNPQRGFIGMANSKISKDVKGIYGESFAFGFRQRRVTELLQRLTKRGKITVQDMIKMQNDVGAVHGREFRDYMLRTVLFAYGPSLPAAAADAPQQQKQHHEETQQQQAAADASQQQQQDDDEEAQQQQLDEAQQHMRHICREEGLSDEDGIWLYKTMATWKADMEVDSIGATIYEVWLQWALQHLFILHAFPAQALKIVLGKSPDKTWLPTTETGSHWPHNLLHALQQNEKVVADVTTPEHLLCSSAAAALTWMRKRYGDDVSQWKWGFLRACFVDHPLAAALPILRHLTSVGPLCWGGNAGTIKAHSSPPSILNMQRPWKKVFAAAGIAPVLRMVVDLGDLKNSYWTLLPGVSGWVGNKHYDDLAPGIEATTGTAHMRQMLWTDEQIAAAAVTHMKLLPKSKAVEGEGHELFPQTSEEL